jgi:GWxTD domain-containing protein
MKPKNQKLLLIVIIAFFALAGNLAAQFSDRIVDKNAFFFDAVAFKSQKDTDKDRLDVFIVVPFETLRFEKAGEKYGAQYTAVIKIFDSTGGKFKHTRVKRNLSAENYFQAQGGGGDFDRIERSFFLPAGKYKAEVVIIDEFDKREYVKTRNVTIIGFDEYDFSLSGVMLVSDIEERDGNFIITPYVSDNIGKLEEGFFVFFESYNKKTIDSADYIYEIYQEEDEILNRSEVKTFPIGNRRNQHYMRVPRLDNISAGKYILQIIALRPGSGEGYTNKDVLAVARRSIEVRYTISGRVMNDLDQAIKQLEYAASADEMDYIESAESRKEKEKRFMQFWREMDPTPSTDRNEAFQQYYARIQYANKNFESYTSGWRTDMGMVYVIFGPPSSVERFRGYSDGKLYERWIYRNNREFIFADNTGFGNFRLVRPYTVTERYEYEQ